MQDIEPEFFERQRPEQSSHDSARCKGRARQCLSMHGCESELSQMTAQGFDKDWTPMLESIILNQGRDAPRASQRRPRKFSNELTDVEMVQTGRQNVGTTVSNGRKVGARFSGKNFRRTASKLDKENSSQFGRRVSSSPPALTSTTRASVSEVASDGHADRQHLPRGYVSSQLGGRCARIGQRISAGDQSVFDEYVKTENTMHGTGPCRSPVSLKQQNCILFGASKPGFDLSFERCLLAMLVVLYVAVCVGILLEL
jgi:hypothetical protein